MKGNGFWFQTYVILLFLFLFQAKNFSQNSFVLDISGQNLNFLNANRTLIYNAGNNGLNAGSKWRYDNLLTMNGLTIYGIFTILETNNASITTFDDETAGTGLPGRFQPRISINTAGGYILYSLEFFEVITDSRLYISDYYFTALDIDGGEFVEIGGYSSYEVNETCALTITNNATSGRTKFQGPTTELDGITFENTSAFIARYNFPYTQLIFALGKSSTGTNRQYSTQFGTVGGVFPNPNTTNNVNKIIAITKTADTNRFASGSNHKYTITLENLGSTADSVTLRDTLPTGLTYVPHSTSIYIPASNVIDSLKDVFNLASYSLNSGSVLWKSNWTEFGDNNSADSTNTSYIYISANKKLKFRALPNGNTYITRTFDLSRAHSAVLSFTYQTVTMGSERLDVQLSTDGVSFSTIGYITGNTTGNPSYTIPSQYFTSNSYIRFVSSTDAWSSGGTSYIAYIDNLKITYYYSKAAETRTNAVTGGTLANGVPPAILTNTDQITLYPGVKATVTFDVAVDCNAKDSIINYATASCPGISGGSVRASHIAYVNPNGVSASRCGTGTVTLTASGASTGQDYKWYSQATGGVPLQTGGSSFVTPPVSASTDYYVSLYNTTTGCETGRTKVTAIVSSGVSGTGTISSTTGRNGSTLNTGAQSPSGAVNTTGAGTVAWTNPGYVTGDDANKVTATNIPANGYSNYLDVAFPNFSSLIPALSTIKGIAVSIQRSGSSTTSNGIRDYIVQLLKNGTAAGDNKAATGTNWPTTEAAAAYGGNADLWGTTWTASDFSAIMLRIQAFNANTSNTRTASVDYVSITVYYSVFGDDQSSVNFSVSGITGATNYTWTAPTGATIASGQGTSSVLMNFNNAGQSGTYNVCVTAKDACDNQLQTCSTIGISDNVNLEISGIVYNDPDGSVAPKKVDGTPISTVGDQQLYVTISKTGTGTISSLPVNTDGTYRFTNLESGSGIYSIYINTRAFGYGQTASSGLPAGASWAGEINNDANNTLTGRTSTVGYLTNLTAGNETNVNFGITVSNPTANNDYATTNEDTSANINITTNDSSPVSTINVSTVDLDPNTSGIQITYLTSNGIWTVNGSGVVTFQPAANYFGKDSIEYTVKDNLGYISNIAKIVVTINPVNDAPSFTKGADQTINEDSGAQTVSNWATNILKGPSNESLQTANFIVTNNNNSLFSEQPYIDSNGTLHYTPALNAYGVATVTVKLKDNGGTDNGGVDESETKTFIITVNSVNDVPVAINDINTTFVNIPVGGQILTNDSDPDSDVLSVTAETKSTAHGSVVINTNGTYTYTPSNGYTGKDSFTYTVCDNGSPQLCTTATVTVNIMSLPTAQNVVLAANNDYYSGNSDKTISGQILSNDFDSKGNSLSVSSPLADTDGDGLADDIISLASGVTVYGRNENNQIVVAGSLTVNSNGTFTFVPNSGFTGNVPFNYSANNGTTTNSASVLIAIVNSSVSNTTFATDDSFLGFEDTKITGNLKSNDYDSEGDSQTVNTTPVSNPAHGSVVLNANGTFTYTPATDYYGPDKFIYEICDNGTPQACDRGTVYLNVAETKDYCAWRSIKDGTWEDNTVWKGLDCATKEWELVPIAPNNDRPIYIYDNVNLSTSANIAADSVYIKPSGVISVPTTATFTVTDQLIFGIDTIGNAGQLNSNGACNNVVTTAAKIIVRKALDYTWDFISFPFEVTANNVFLAGTNTNAIWGNIRPTATTNASFYAAQYDGQARSLNQNPTPTNSNYFVNVTNSTFIPVRGYIISGGRAGADSIDFVAAVGTQLTLCNGSYAPEHYLNPC